MLTVRSQLLRSNCRGHALTLQIGFPAVDLAVALARAVVFFSFNLPIRSLIDASMEYVGRAIMYENGT